MPQGTLRSMVPKGLAGSSGRSDCEPHESAQRCSAACTTCIAPQRRLCARGLASQPILDVTAGLSQSVKLLLQQPDVMWLTPVEAGIRGTQSGSANLVAVAVPANWTQTDAPLVEVISTPQGLNARTRDGFALAAAATPRFIPGDRVDARAVLSGTERAVYFVGGLRAGAPTGEIWRYDLDRSEWTHVLQPSNDIGPDDAPPPSSHRALPGRVLALGYQDVSGKLVAVDEQVGKGTGPLSKLKVARLLVFDFKTNTSRVALTVPRLGVFDDIRLVARETGTFVLVAVRRAAEECDRVRVRSQTRQQDSVALPRARLRIGVG